jgi:hypothetical protein
MGDSDNYIQFIEEQLKAEESVAWLGWMSLCFFLCARESKKKKLRSSLRSARHPEG